MSEPACVIQMGDCQHLLAAMPENSVDAIVTDPPYGLGFMGKEWDALPPGREWAEACLRVLKPGGHLLAFGGSRTWHRLAVAIEDGGFELRDSIAWLYGSGFPKSMDVSKAIDKTAPTTPEAQQWEGWGTALKPAFEPIVVARKPFPGTVAANVLDHGTGALNIDACRTATSDKLGGGQTGGAVKFGHEGWNRPWMDDPEAVAASSARHAAAVAKAEGLGRWPANVVLDEDQAAVLDERAPKTGAQRPVRGQEPSSPTKSVYGNRNRTQGPFHGDRGGASRFFYVAKAPKSERVVVDGVAHPTVKPLALMRWLVRLVTPPDGLVLDTFAGSGTTGEAAILEGFNVHLMEREEIYMPLIQTRVRRAASVGRDLFGGVA